MTQSWSPPFLESILYGSKVLLYSDAVRTCQVTLPPALADLVCKVSHLFSEVLVDLEGTRARSRTVFSFSGQHHFVEFWKSTALRSRSMPRSTARRVVNGDGLRMADVTRLDLRLLLARGEGGHEDH